MWQGITGPLKRFTGTATTVALKKGSIILNLQATAQTNGGSVSGIPDGQGGFITVTLTKGDNGINIDPKHLGIVMTADGNIVFTGTDYFWLEVMCKDGF